MGIRLLVYLVLAALLYWGLRRILRDWRKKFAADEAEDRRRLDAQRERNRAEAQKPGVIDLKRGEDGVYRPGGKEGDNQ